ncbi:sporulation protein YqfC [Clostridium akagii]|uniref:sporulation protein YqfC n=1 Tax=Clostridium akagii TaxID=91623 RepID=UPI00047E15D5|nr:sporulation protein YqfC [Clostridium akagii]
MENKISKVKEKLADKLDIPKDIALSMPRIIVIGNEEITIENHQGILKFCDDFIKVKCCYGNMYINGYNLEILFISGRTVVLGGKFKSIEYEGRNDGE